MLAPNEYGLLRLDKKANQWVMDDVKPHVSIRLKQLFPRLKKNLPCPFYLDNTKDVCADIEWFISRYPFKTSKKDAELLKQSSDLFHKNRAEIGKITLPTWKPTSRKGLKKGQKFRKYQKTAIDFVEAVKSCVVIDDVGLGKTYEGLGMGLIDGNLPMIVVCEPHLQEQWLEKAEEFIDLKVHTVKGNTPYDLPADTDIFLFKYTQLSPWVDVLTQGWAKAIIFDEVQQLRTGEKSAKGSAAKQICETIEVRVGLTATLIFNYGIEAFNIVNILRPGLLGTRDEFLREWCSDSHKGVVADPEALGAYLRETQFMLRRTKRDVGQESAQLKPEIIDVPIDENQIRDAEEIAEALAIRTLTSDFADAGMAARELDMHMRHMTGVAKAKGTAALAKVFLEAEIPLLMFGWHRDVYDIWKDILYEYNPLFYTGSESTYQKEVNKRAFINGESNLMIMSLRSGSGADGIQKRCSTVLIAELDWSQSVHKQCVGRVDRDDPQWPVHVYYAVCDYGSDPVMIDSLGVKKSQLRGIQDEGKKSDMKQVDKSRLKKLAKTFLKKRGVDVHQHEKPEADKLGQIDLL